MFFTAALAEKAVVLAQLGQHPLLQPLGELDTAFYVELGRTVANGGPLAFNGPFAVSPLYVYFLASVFALGGSIATARVIQILLGSASVVLTFVVARHWFGERAAWLASVLAVFTGLFTFYEILILPAALDPFLVALTLTCVSRAQVARGWQPLAGAGVSAGLLVLNRPNALLYAGALAVLPAFMWWRGRARQDTRMSFGRALVLPAALLVVLLPNGCRNYAASGEWILVSSHGGLNFYIGNGPEADGTYSRIPGISPSVAGQARDAARVAEAATGRSLSAREVSDYFYARAWDWIIANPAAAVRLWIRKFMLVVNRVNVPLNFSYAYYGREEQSLLRGLVVGPWLLLPLGVVGLFLRTARRNLSGFWAWASFVPLYGMSVIAFFVSSRYRMPLLVPLCIAAGGMLAWGYDQVRDRRLGALLRPAVAVTGIALMVNWPLGLDDGRGLEQIRQAVWFVEQGRVGEALEYVRRIEPSHAHPGVLRYRVGRALAAANRFPEAIDQFRRSLELDPGQAATQLEVGQALTVAGRGEDAVPYLRAAVEGGHRVDVAAPWLVRALVAGGRSEQALNLIATWPDSIAAPRAETALDLGTMALELEAPATAERWLRLAVAVQPASAEAHEKLGVSLLLQDHVGASVACLETARTLEPARPSVRLNLAVAYARAGRVDGARVEAREAIRLDPTERRAATLLKALEQK